MKYLSPEFRLMRFLAKGAGWKNYQPGETMRACMNPDGTLDVEKVRALFLNRGFVQSSSEFDTILDSLKSKDMVEHDTSKPKHSIKGKKAAKDKLTEIEDRHSQIRNAEQAKVGDRPFRISEMENIKKLITEIEF